MVRRLIAQAFFFILMLVIAPLSNATLYVYRGPSGEKIVVNTPQTGSDYTLIGKTDDVNSVSPLVGRMQSSVSEITKAAEQGSVEAQFNLGTMYFTGEGAPQDYKQALSWYTKAAEQGYAGAQSRLGAIYFTGLGGPLDYKQALSWYTKAAEQGDADAQRFLGGMYENGNGVVQDFKKAYIWFSLSATNGDRIAAKKRDDIASKLSPSGMEQSQQEAAVLMQKIEKNKSTKK